MTNISYSPDYLVSADDAEPVTLEDYSSEMSSVDTALQALRRGKMIIVVDDPSRENEGDFVVAAEHVTPEIINFMAIHGRGLICVPMSQQRLAALAIAPMVKRNTDPRGTAFHVSVDVKKNTTTGISAHDRSATILALADPRSAPDDFMQPGHIFPLAARTKGVLARRGHTEAAVDLMRLAGLIDVAVICEIAAPDGRMAQLPLLAALAKRFDLHLISIEDLVEFRLARERDALVDVACEEQEEASV